MKVIKKIFLNACAYTVMLLAAFFVFATVGIGEKALMSFSSFSVLFLIGLILSASGFIYKIEKLKYPIRVAIHFSLMLCSFMLILNTMGYLAERAPSAYIVIVFGFALVYTAVYIAAYFLKKLLARIGTKIDKKLEKSKKPEKKKADYTPLYK